MKSNHNGTSEKSASYTVICTPSTLFSEATPLALIEFLRPHILVKGGDYTLDTVVGRKEVEAFGGEVRIVSYVSGVSTTGIIDSVIARYGAGADHA